jgi:hypothetical protein
MIASTVKLYSATITETAGAIVRAPFVWLMLIALPLVISALAVLVSPLGIIGGFAIGFASVYLYGAYLYGVGQSIERRKALGFGIIRESMGHHVWDVMHIAFVHWVCSLVFGLGGLPAMVPALLGLAAFILFNPWPEVIHSERTSGAMDILVRSFRFMSEHGPEWVIPHLVLVAIGFGFTLYPMGLEPVVGLGLGVFLHPVMVFRGVLYRKLGKGNRRVRAWRDQF